MSISKETIGKRIASARKKAHMTQAKLAERIGISEKYLSRIECGKQLPSIMIVAKICDVLCVSADVFLGQTNICDTPSIQNELNTLSLYEQKRIAEIIKIIKKIKKHTWKSTDRYRNILIGCFIFCWLWYTVYRKCF